MLPKLLTVEDVSVLLGIGKATTYQLVRKMKHVRIGRRILVNEEDLHSYIEEQSKSNP